ncbi:hypothetical protein NC651_013493 [Populus alba x Populus x berolinensis]|nr:hypothetical protein NC651_013493 [Populus alba x Populus x berolinensis]
MMVPSCNTCTFWHGPKHIGHPPWNLGLKAMCGRKLKGGRNIGPSILLESGKCLQFFLSCGSISLLAQYRVIIYWPEVLYRGQNSHTIELLFS